MTEPDPEHFDGSYWLLKLHENVSIRRGQMFRIFQTLSQAVLFGNGGGVALLFSINLNPDQGSPEHYLTISGIICFGIGLIAAAGCMALLAGIIVKEAHAAETALHDYIKGDVSKAEIVRVIDPTAFPLARSTTALGMLAAIGFVSGAVLSLALAVSYL